MLNLMHGCAQAALDYHSLLPRVLMQEPSTFEGCLMEGWQANSELSFLLQPPLARSLLHVPAQPHQPVPAQIT